MKGILSVLIIASIVAFPVTAIEAPEPVCHKIYVTHPKIAVTGRAQKGNKIVPITIIDQDSAESHREIKTKLTKKQPVYHLPPLPDGWRYIEVRVVTKWDTPLATIPDGSRCVDIVFEKKGALTN